MQVAGRRRHCGDGCKDGCSAPPAGPWLQMLCEVIERIPFAMLVTDVCVPGLPITYCNAAMAKCLGYQCGEIRGRNCRFLQGPLTEASAVRQMIVAIRTAEPTTVRVTNYHRDGVPQHGLLSPVIDSRAYIGTVLESWPMLLLQSRMVPRSRCFVPCYRRG